MVVATKTVTIINQRTWVLLPTQDPTVLLVLKVSLASFPQLTIRVFLLASPPCSLLILPWQYACVKWLDVP
jgi:hypothetical protein